MSVGILMTLYAAAVVGQLSTFTFVTLTLSHISSAKAPSIGSICWHGPHHSAQKSTSTTPEDIFSVKLSSVNSTTHCIFYFIKN